MFKHFFEPSDQVLECVFAGDVVDQQSADGSSVVGTGDASERFLSSRVPDLKLDLALIPYSDSPRPKLDPNGQIMGRLEPLIRELQKQARFSYGGVAHDYVLENVRVAVGHC